MSWSHTVPNIEWKIFPKNKNHPNTKFTWMHHVWCHLSVCKYRSRDTQKLLYSFCFRRETFSFSIILIVLSFVFAIVHFLFYFFSSLKFDVNDEEYKNKKNFLMRLETVWMHLKTTSYLIWIFMMFFYVCHWITCHKLPKLLLNHFLFQTTSFDILLSYLFCTSFSMYFLWISIKSCFWFCSILYSLSKY